VLNNIIIPVMDDLNYEVKRGDQINESGVITSQIIDCLVNYDLVIADLTDHNPNVFHEIAVRHATGKPCIFLILSNQKIPFDVATYRTICIEGFDYELVTTAQRQLREFVMA